MRDLDKIAEQLFDKIRSRFSKVTLGDKNSKSTNDPAEARFFNFDYVDNGVNFGNVTVGILDEQSLNIYFSRNITSGLDASQRRKWYSFLKSMRLFAKQNLLNFDTHDISRANLGIRDIHTIVKSKQSSTLDDSAVSEDSKFDGDCITDYRIDESRLHGSRYRSYENCGNSKIIIRHSSPIDDTVRGARTRKIESIFIETDDGERFKMPFTRLAGARAMATHITEGGSVNDEIGNAISNLVSEMDDMAVFVRKTRAQQFEDATTQKMIEAAKKHYRKIKETLRKAQTPNGYLKFVESCSSEDSSIEGYDPEEMKDRFTRTIFDDSLEKAFPSVFRAYQDEQKTESARYDAIKEMVTSPDFQLVMRESEIDSVIPSMKFKDTSALIDHVMGEVAERAQDELIREFAANWISGVNTLVENNDETVSESDAIAAKITSAYLRSLRESKKTPQERIKELNDEIVDEVAKFENWAESLLESMGLREKDIRSPITVKAAEDLRALMSEPFEVGVDGVNATNAMAGIISDDDLADMFYDADPNEDARPIIRSWLSNYLQNNDQQLVAEPAAMGILRDVVNSDQAQVAADEKATESNNKNLMSRNTMKESPKTNNPKATYSDYVQAYASQDISGTDEKSDAKAIVAYLKKHGKDANLETAIAALRRLSESRDSSIGFLESVNLLKKLSGI